MNKVFVAIITVIVLFGSRNCLLAQDDEVTYKGKPASFWLKQLKDRDVSFRLTAIKALREIGTDGGGVVALALCVPWLIRTKWCRRLLIWPLKV